MLKKIVDGTVTDDNGRVWHLPEVWIGMEGMAILFHPVSLEQFSSEHAARIAMHRMAMARQILQEIGMQIPIIGVCWNIPPPVGRDTTSQRWRTALLIASDEARARELLTKLNNSDSTDEEPPKIGNLAFALRRTFISDPW